MRELHQNQEVQRQSLPPLVVVSANSCWNIVNFRAHLVRDLIARGFRVAIVSPADEHCAAVKKLHADYHPIALNSSGLSPVEDVRLTMTYRRLFRDLHPVAFLGFTAKPNIYGSIAARGLNIRVINNISGLGTAFMRRGLLQMLVAGLYRFALRDSSTVFFQNSDDRALFINRKLARTDQTGLLPGSGVDLDYFSPRPLPSMSGRPLRFLLVARMLRDKGVREFVAAARLARAEGMAAHFALLGPSGGDNRTAISDEELAAWEGEGIVEYLGPTDDVRPHLTAADCIVLPSYREGLPRSLIEAAAMARPVITTDVPGCREAVDDGVTGFLCRVRSSESLAAALQRMTELSLDQREAMGRRGRDKAVREFSQLRVSNAYAEALSR